MGIKLHRVKFLIIFLIILLLYLLSFFNFLEDINNVHESPKTLEAVVILTGSKGRLGLGLEYMENNSKVKMLISGVGKGVKYSDLPIDDSVNKNNITLGFNAKNTMQNAIETLNWVEYNHIKSFLLVTDNWHMKRSLILFNSVIPNVEIYPKKLTSINMNINFYLKEPKITVILIVEHLKYLVSHIQILYYWISN